MRADLVSREMTARFWHGMVCVVVGLVVGFGEFILGGLRWGVSTHMNQAASTIPGMLILYLIMSLEFVLPVGIIFLILYIALRDRLFQRWWLSAIVAFLLGIGTAFTLLYGFLYREFLGRQHFPLLPFLGRTVLASLSMFLLGTVFSRHKSSNQAMQRTAGRSDA